MDARIEHSQKVIKEAFLTLFKERDIEKITVTDICKLADVNRATFYKYYEGPSDLLSKLEDSQFANLAKSIENVDDFTFETICRALKRDIDNNLEFYYLIFTHECTPNYRKKLALALKGTCFKLVDKNFVNLNDSQKENLYYFIISGILGVFMQWISMGMKEPLDELMAFINSYVGNTFEHGKYFSI